MIQINAPIWNGGKRCVGIAEYRIRVAEPFTVFEVLYSDRHNKRIYPQPFRIRTARLMAAPTQQVRGGMILRVVLLADCEVFQ